MSSFCVSLASRSSSRSSSGSDASFHGCTAEGGGGGGGGAMPRHWPVPVVIFPPALPLIFSTASTDEQSASRPWPVALIPRHAVVSGCTDLIVRPVDSHSSFFPAVEAPQGQSHTCEPIAVNSSWISCSRRCQCEPSQINNG